jgi:hypothetical protein
MIVVALIVSIDICLIFILKYSLLKRRYKVDIVILACVCRNYAIANSLFKIPCGGNKFFWQ